MIDPRKNPDFGTVDVSHIDYDEAELLEEIEGLIKGDFLDPIAELCNTPCHIESSEWVTYSAPVFMRLLERAKDQLLERKIEEHLNEVK